MRKFNIAGPCDPEFHYLIAPESRLPEARGLIEDRGYFVLHAPRQTGKTTALRALARALTAEGRYAALHASCEAGEPAQDDFLQAQQGVLNEIRLRAVSDLPEALRPPSWPDAPATSLLRSALEAWCRTCPLPVVLFLDEIDALQGESLRSVLRQLRAAYAERPRGAPWSVVLCGLRDVRDYKAASGGDPDRLGTSSPFNIKMESLRLSDFSAAEVRALYCQHSAETDQPFTPAALDRAFELTQGQPWLVNALARETTEKMGIAPPAPITVEAIDEAKERLILARATHLDSLVKRLSEPRVQRVIEPLIAGSTLPSEETYDDDVSYVRDLGLIAPGSPARVANPIYREVIVRVLGARVEDMIEVGARSYVDVDGRLDFQRLLEQFATFWREHGEVLTAGSSYREVAPQLVLMAYLQRVVNGGGSIEREYGVGRGRIDLLVRWPYAGQGGPRELQREALEIKVWRERRPDPLEQGLEQIDGYLARLGLESGTLVLFDRRPDAPPFESRTYFEQAATQSGRAIRVVRA